VAHERVDVHIGKSLGELVVPLEGRPHGEEDWMHTVVLDRVIAMCSCEQSDPYFKFSGKNKCIFLPYNLSC